MIMAVVLLLDEDGSREATAYAHAESTVEGELGELLPPGMWRIVCECGGGYGTLAVEYMPDHWRRQIELGGEIGRRLQQGGSS